MSSQFISSGSYIIARFDSVKPITILDRGTSYTSAALRTEEIFFGFNGVDSNIEFSL